MKKGILLFVGVFPSAALYFATFSILGYETSPTTKAIGIILFLVQLMSLVLFVYITERDKRVV